MLEPEEVKRWERLTAAMLHKASQDDAAAFAQIVKVLDRTMDQLPGACHKLRHPMRPAGAGPLDGPSWAEIAAELGVTKSAAYQRFGRVSRG